MSGNKFLSVLLAALLIGAGCARAPAAAPSAPAPSTQAEAAYVLTALSDTTQYDRAPVPTTFGCGDRLSLQRVAVPKSDRPALEVNLNTLFALKRDDIEALGLYSPFADKGLHAEVREENGKIILNVVGDLASGGVCDDPRIHAMIEETIKLSTTDAVEIRLNGSASLWRCQADMSGRCK